MLLVAVHPTLPARSIAELTALAKREPGKLTFGWGSSVNRMAPELYKLTAGVNITDIPYKTNPLAATDLLGGRISLMMGDLGLLVPHAKSGAIRPLAVTGIQRSPQIPDVPTMQEAGVPDYGMTFWLAAYLPAGTPRDIVSRINSLFVAALDRPKVKEYLEKAGQFPFPTTSDELMRFQISEHDKWRKIIQAAGIQPE